jgi:hypothetical protein
MGLESEFEGFAAAISLQKAPVRCVRSAPPLRPLAPGTIQATRVAVLRGKVESRDGTALPGVKISVLSHPELGQTFTRADGAFDVAVNGGGQLTVCYERDGFLAAEFTRSRSPKPVHRDHRKRSMAITENGPSRSVARPVGREIPRSPRADQRVRAGLTLQ